MFGTQLENKPSADILAHVNIFTEILVNCYVMKHLSRSHLYFHILLYFSTAYYTRQSIS